MKNKDIIYIVIIFVFITASAGSLFAGWKHIKYLESERDVLKSNNKELLKEKLKMFSNIFSNHSRR